MSYHLKTVYFDDGDVVEVGLTFATIDAVLDWVRLLSQQNGKVRMWYRFTMTVIRTEE